MLKKKLDTALIEMKRTFKSKIKNDFYFTNRISEDTNKKYIKNILDSNPYFKELSVKNFTMTTSSSDLYIHNGFDCLVLNFKDKSFEIKKTNDWIPSHKIMLGNTEISKEYLVALNKMNTEFGVSLKKEIKIVPIVKVV